LLASCFCMRRRASLFAVLAALSFLPRIVPHDLP
jgi:hypothetical protein